MSSWNDFNEVGTCELAVGELIVEFEELPCCGFGKEKAGASVDDDFVNENCGTDLDADGCDENGPPNGDALLF